MFTNVADCETGIRVDGEYRIWVHNYRNNESDALSFANSGAKVVIRRDNSIIHTIDLAHASGTPTDRLWYVCRFELKLGGNIENYHEENRFVPGTKDDKL